MSNEQQKNHIHDLCLKSGMTCKEFEDKICDLINADENGPDTIPDHSTMNRWYNGVSMPQSNMIKYVAKALEVSEDEINLGRTTNASRYLKQIEELNELLTMSDEEKMRISRLLFVSKYWLRLAATLLVFWGIFLLNLSLWKNPWLFLGSCIALLCVELYDKHRQRKDDEQTSSEFNTLKDRFREDWDFLKLLMKKELVSRIALNMVLVVFGLAFLPVIEMVYYKGKFFVSVTIYFMTAIFFLVESVSE